MFNLKSWPTLYGSLTFFEFSRLGHFLRNIRARAMKLGSYIHLEE